jgi:hypothetical protein
MRGWSLVFALISLSACATPGAGAGSQGPPGVAGERGPKGDPGPRGPEGRPIRKGEVQFLSAVADGKAGEEPTAFVVCARPKDVLLSGGCQVKTTGTYDWLINRADNVSDPAKPAGFTCQIRIPKNTPFASVTATAFCLRSE